MPRPIIIAENLSKQYRIGALQEPYGNLREALTRAARAPFNRIGDVYRNTRAALRKQTNGSTRPLVGSQSSNTVWALNDVSFEVHPGEVLGIIGRNGAGKSTLLKLLSRVTEPTRGRAELYGRVGSLLEVGTGFHPELTGRENIYLNGAILGMRRREIERNFGAIVEFAEVESFLDTPVKRYSSGMYLRLAFAVAAHLEPEILIVDEVLAVGDAAFQHKCFEKLRQVRACGRTILFVSHNMSALRQVCSHGLLLERGRVKALGDFDIVADEYAAPSSPVGNVPRRAETASFTVEDVAVRSRCGRVIEPFGAVEIRVRVMARVPIGSPGLYVGICMADGQRLAGLDLRDFCSPAPLRAGEQMETGFIIQSLPLLPGTYYCEIYLKDIASHRIEKLPDAFRFEVTDAPVYAGRKLDDWFGVIGLKAEPIRPEWAGERISPHGAGVR